ncbi:MAG: chromosome partitioning protein ParA [Flavobacteriaceae bacterium]
MESKKSGNGLKIALGIVLALLVGTGLYTLNLYSNSKQVEKDLTEQKQLVMNDLNTMAKQYDKAIADNDVANKDLVEARARIQGLIDSLKISETNIKSLWGYKQKYLTLQKEMDALMAQNESLRIQNSYLASSLDSTRVRLEERAVFSDSLLQQNTALAKVVSDASVLSAVQLKGSGAIVRTSGKVVPTERAGRSDKIQVCFIVAKNALVQAGDQELYIQVVDPNNAILGLNEQVQFDDVTLNYSTISKFNYENTNLNVCEFVTGKNGSDDFEKGRYIVNVYNEKNLVAVSEFTLK